LNHEGHEGHEEKFFYKRVPRRGLRVLRVLRGEKNMNEPTYKNIAIIRLSALGDIVHTLPAFALLREALPHSVFSWIVEPPGAKLLNNFTGIDRVIVLDIKKKSVGGQLKEIKRFCSLYRKTFDLVLDFQGLLKSAVLARLLKGRLTVGFHKKNLKESPARFFYNRSASYFDETDREDSANHVVFKNIHLALPFCGGGSTGKTKADWRRIKVPLADLGPWEKSVTDFLARNRLETKQFLIVNVGGGWESKLLPAHRYIDIIKGLNEKYRVVVLWGNETEKKVAEEVSRETGAVPAVFFNFSQLILLIRYSRLLVTGDTLALHLADLVKTPSVGIFGPTSPFRNGSLMEESVSIFKKSPCGFCYKKKCGTIECLANINTETVIQSIETHYEKHS